MTNPTILYIDDDADDLQLLEEAFNYLDGSYEMAQATNGEEGLEKLYQLKKVGTLPCLIVLDLNMPKLNGRQTFEKIKADPALSSIPVVIFSTSNNNADKAHFRGDTVAYMTKPILYADLLSAAKQLLNYCTEQVAHSA